MKLNFNKISNIPALGIILAAFCAVSAVAMAYTAVKTEKPIREKKQQAIQDAFKLVLPDFNNQPSENKIRLKTADGADLTIYGAVKDGKLVGFAVETSTNTGYAGKIEAIVSLHLDGRIRSINVTKHGETPGLGSNICGRSEEKTIFNIFEKSENEGKLPPNRYLDWYNDKMPGKNPWTVKKDGGEAEYMTGATVTCRAIADIANRAAKTFQANRDEVISALTPKSEVTK
ncbi:MAG: RnfABCDGE type electron transport complex subunit G [Victivallaceae bacterium]|jgi:electron transport complex protein RnfG|nr:RnfABCDGE type electron transport complex subunit G [Victivallaceae bacterium]NLK83609.1 RnfABCDGE type electron transport complex subunit G [Lentisphaerota bacterium]MDD3116314.1 RnfABCDGE type electron transport complex subunit G [Victivallaceae bacterium]MDD3702764.1 RnfABCDGE type electron transport complex subunit G [Victivallaceae bacterium]MDD4317476.1 RnfABCDGE type electron transport complex subunit G [Victivallaceae bacterium]